MTLATGDMKRTKRRGPRTEPPPWGTPVFIVVLSEEEDDDRVNSKFPNKLCPCANCD